MNLRRGLAILLVVLAAATSRAQGNTAPVWPTPDHFWFRTTVGGAYEWWHVDVLNGVRERLFDHARLAIEINLKTNGDFTAKTLPFADPANGFVVKYDGSNSFTQEGALAIEFRIDEKRWRCELQGEWDWARKPPSDYECSEPESGAMDDAVSTAVLSPDAKWEALVRDHNVFIRTAGGTPKALSTDGTAAEPYHAGSLRWSKDSRTVSAYRVHNDVWQSPPVTGGVKAQIKKQDWQVAK